jgi:hypothetical protein
MREREVAKHINLIQNNSENDRAMFESFSYNLKKIFCYFLDFFSILNLSSAFRKALGKIFTECPKKVLGKESFADKMFTEYSLPSVTLGKAFVECKMAFTDCLRHSAKNAIPIVFPLSLR